ncbi:MAG: dipicolinate synthase subunit DpsA [Oscillospiraceae bacterium]
MLLGGDDRMVRLTRLLEKDGHRVSPFALEKALPCREPDFRDADGVILPLPAQRNGALNAPLSEKSWSTTELLFGVSSGTPVLAGQAGPGLRDFCAQRGLRLYDYFLREDMAVKNAALTAEGAIDVMLRSCTSALAGSRVLLCGFGRVGRLLALKLKALGAEVTVAARSPADLAWAEVLGCRTAPLGQRVGPLNFVVNTIPQPLFGERELDIFGDAHLLELASPPYGFDLDAATALGKPIILAPGLPAATAPESAARVIRDTIYRILEENP